MPSRIVSFRFDPEDEQRLDNIVQRVAVEMNKRWWGPKANRTTVLKMLILDQWERYRKEDEAKLQKEIAGHQKEVKKKTSKPRRAGAARPRPTSPRSSKVSAENSKQTAAAGRPEGTT